MRAVAIELLGGSAGLAVFFLIGLLGGAHCLGMCGPLVTTYANRLGAQPDRTRWADVRQHALFNAGRTASYATIGAVMGALGGLLFDAAAVVRTASGVRAIVGVAVGVAIIGVGLSYAVRGTTAMPGSLPGLDGLFARAAVPLTARIDAWVQGPRIAGLGALHGFLPCPILYPAFLYALASGSAVEGGLSLGVLGAGTFPTLFVYGTLFQTIEPSTRVHLHRALGVVFIVLGYLPLAMGLGAVGVELPHPAIPIYQPLG